MTKKIDFPAVVIAELERRKMSKYALVQRLGGKISASHLYDWLAGRKRISDDKLSLVLAELQMKLIPGERREL